MPINYPINVEYEYFLYYNGADVVTASGSFTSLTARNINPVGLLGFVRRQEVVPMPESPGGILITDGHADAEPIQFFYEAWGDTNHSDDTFVTMAGRMSVFRTAGQIQYLRALLYNGSSTTAYRIYGSMRMGSSVYARRTLYRVMRGELLFDLIDPDWYLDGNLSDTVTVTAGSGSKVVTDGGNRRTNRVLLYITRTGATVPTNPTVKNAANHSLTITGTLASISDYWLVDMYSGTVFKSVSGVLSNDIANVAGRFWGILNGTDTITVTDTNSANFTVTVLWLPRLT